MDNKRYSTVVAETFTYRRILIALAINGIVLLSLKLGSGGPFDIDAAEVATLGNPQPFLQSTEIAASLGVPLLIRSHKRPDNVHGYERIEQFSAHSDYDHLDAVFWDLTAMASDIRPTKKMMLIRNYLLYLAGIWLFSILISIYHRNWLLQPTIFLLSACLLFSYRTQTLFKMDYPVQGMITVAPVFMAVFCAMLCQVLRDKPGRMRYWLAAFFLTAFFLRYISVIHSANQSGMLIMLAICGTLFHLRFSPPRRIVAGVLLVAFLGAASFDLFVAGLRKYRDEKMEFVHERPEHDSHSTFSLIYLGIGVFENSLGLDDSDYFIWNRNAIESKAAVLGVSISPDERARIGGAPRVDPLFFRLWMSYVSAYPMEYLVNRVKANAWIIARMALRDIYPLLSAPEQVFWCVLAVGSWAGFAMLMGVFVRCKLPLESVVIFVAGFVALSLMGILGHPVRGIFAAMPAALAAISAFTLILHRELPLPIPKAITAKIVSLRSRVS